MAFLLYLHREHFSPEDPQIIDGHIKPDTQFTFVDFVPSAIKRTTTAVMQTAEIHYHRFREMITISNEWLAKNPCWQVVNCESVTLMFKLNSQGDYELRQNDASFYIYGSEKNNILKALRLWVKRRTLNDGLSIQTLNYIDIVPESFEDEESYGPRMESLEQVISRVNQKISEQNFIAGTILTIESLNCMAEVDWKIDPEQTLTAFTSKTVVILRIFYEQGAVNRDHIGIIDFIPNHISGGGFFKRPRFEPFSVVLMRATRWLAENQVNFKNAQSLDVKIKSMTTVQAKSMCFTEHGDYLKTLRIAYTKPSGINCESKNEDSESSNTPGSLILGSKLFMPTRKSDLISDLKQRIDEWATSMDAFDEKKQKEAKACSSSSDTIARESPGRSLEILGAETVQIFCRSDDDGLKKGVDETFQANRFGSKNGYIFILFRVYFDIGWLPNISFLPENQITSMGSSDNSTSCIIS